MMSGRNFSNTRLLFTGGFIRIEIRRAAVDYVVAFEHFMETAGEIADASIGRVLIIIMEIVSLFTRFNRLLRTIADGRTSAPDVSGSAYLQVQQNGSIVSTCIVD